ncbi:zinc finger protein 883 isoform X2 [Nematostella vectensis]|uniref:zinc finger protein 883 isoform X2 n=1 Tax=Nematostella vectensis TaxID=45351 RepID=UPI00207735A2|nr:zinc finger protein 883 isoform X2 [Nematostella vectensis]
MRTGSQGSLRRHSKKGKCFRNSSQKSEPKSEKQHCDDFEELGRIAMQLDTDSSFFDDSPSHQAVKHDTDARYPKRPRATKNSYREAEVPDDDHYLFCEECQDLHYGECPIHGPLQAIADNATTSSTQTTARATLPHCLEIKTSSIPNAGLGVFSKSRIAKRVMFGPYKGTKVKLSDEQMENDTSYMWEISRDGNFNHFIDGHDEEQSNWMRFVNCSRCEKEQNLVTFQYRGQIFYRSYKDVHPGTELLVWYGDKYANDLGIALEDVEDSNIIASLDTKDYTCKKCSRCFTSSNALLWHRKRCYIEPTGDELKCKLCQQQCATPKTLTGHIVSEHCENSSRVCPICEKDFCDYRYMIMHILTHTKYKPYKCTQCGKAFAHASSLTEHMRTHSGEKPHKCTQCGKAFARASVLTRHMRTHSGEKPHKCTQCGKAFAHAGNLTTHMRTHSGEKPHKCTQCGKAFAQPSVLTRHMRTHSGEKPHKCTQCGKAFARASVLTRHMRTHSGEKPHKCTQCGKVFAQAGNLTTHMRTHSGEKPHKCTQCGKVFAQAGNLTTHMRTHSGEKPHKCTQCGKAFVHASNLTKHMRIHSGEKPCKCTQCGKVFAHTSHLTKHMRTHSREKH